MSNNGFHNEQLSKRDIQRALKVALIQHPELVKRLVDEYRITRVDPDKIYKALGENVRRFREKLDLKQEDIADMLGMQRTSITNIEAGRQRVQIHTLYDLAQILKTSPEKLMPQLSKKKAG